MEDEDKTKAELIKELNDLQEEQENKEQYRVLFEKIPLGIVKQSADGNIISANPAAERMLGLTIDQMQGRLSVDPRWRAIHQDGSDFPGETHPAMVALKTGKEVSDVVMGAFHPVKKSYTWIMINTVLQFHPGQERPYQVFTIFNDITKRKQAEKALAKSEEKFRITLKNSPIVVWNQDKDLRYTWIYNPNPGFKPEETIGKTDKELLSSGDAEKLMHIKRKVLESGIGVREETKTTIQGNDFYYDLTVEPLLDLNNTIIGITCVAIDITSRRKAEEALRLHAVMMDNVAEGIYLTGLDDLLIKWTNEKFASMFGYDPGELVGKQVDIINASTEKTPAKIRISIVDILKETGEWHGEVRNIKRDGTHFWCHANVFLFDHPEYGKVAVSVHTDITERKQAEKALAESEENYRTVFENTGTATVIIEEDITISMANTQCEKLSGYSKKEIKNKMKWTDFILPEDLERIKKYHIERIKSGGKPPTEYEFRLINKKGNIRDIFMRIGMVPNTKKSIASLMDITERKQAEERIKHLNLVLRAIRNINQLIVKEKDREKLIQKACKSFTEARGYHNAWIVLLDEKEKLKSYAEAGLGKAFLSMVAQFMEGKLTACGQKTLKQEDVTIIEDPISTCTDCPLAQKYSGRGAMTIRLEHSGKVYGIMSVSVPADFIPDKEEQSLLKEVAGDIALGLHSIELKEKLDEHAHHLKERVKEFNFLFQLSQLLEKTDISLEDIIQKLTGFLPAAWQYPEITCVRISFEGKKYQTENFKETVWKLMKEIKIGKKIIGTLEVFYLKERPEADKGPFLKEEKILIAIIAERLGSFIDRKSSVVQLKQSYQKIKIVMNATIETVSKIIEAKDPYTAGHQQRVSQLAVAIAKELDLSQDKVEGIRITSLIHDIGKIGVPSEILSKPTTLTDIEFSLIKVHSQIGYDILKSIDFSYPVAQIVLQHHERINGSGYPNQLKGDEILLEAKILGIADVVEAMASHRPYRPALGIDVALEEISKNKGTLYDSKVVEACLKFFKEKGFKFE